MFHPCFRKWLGTEQMPSHYFSRSVSPYIVPRVQWINSHVDCQWKDLFTGFEMPPWCHLATIWKNNNFVVSLLFFDGFPNGNVHGANMGSIWGRQDPGGPHVGPMNLAICFEVVDIQRWRQPLVLPETRPVFCLYQSNVSSDERRYIHDILTSK